MAWVPRNSGLAYSVWAPCRYLPDMALHHDAKLVDGAGFTRTLGVGVRAVASQSPPR